MSSHHFKLSTIARPALIAFVLPLLSGCTTLTLEPDQKAALRRVGVVSLLPSELRYEKVGITVFNNERTTRPLGDLLNVAARVKAVQVIRASGREAVLLEGNAHALAAKMRAGVLVMDSPVERIADELRPLVRDHKLDGLVVIGELFDAENGRVGVRMYLRAGMSDIRFAVASGDIMTIVVDSTIRKMASQGRGTSFAVERHGGQPWHYVLENNLDGDTVDRVNLQMRRVVESVVGTHLEALGF